MTLVVVLVVILPLATAAAAAAAAAASAAAAFCASLLRRSVDWTLVAAAHAFLVVMVAFFHSC